jgi:hypothetical protein
MEVRNEQQLHNLIQQIKSVLKWKGNKDSMDWMGRAVWFTFQELNERQKVIGFAKEHGTALIRSSCS